MKNIILFLERIYKKKIALNFCLAHFSTNMHLIFNMLESIPNDENFKDRIHRYAEI